MTHAFSRLVFDRAPLRVYWELTRACDLACRHCRAQAVRLRHPNELNSVEGMRLLAQLAAFGDPKPHLVLTGGDPLKRPDLWALIAGARALGLGVSVAPSATPLLTAAVLARLREAGVEAISLSLDGSTPERHGGFRGLPSVDRDIHAVVRDEHIHGERLLHLPGEFFIGAHGVRGEDDANLAVHRPEPPRTFRRAFGRPLLRVALNRSPERCDAVSNVHQEGGRIQPRLTVQLFPHETLQFRAGSLLVSLGEIHLDAHATVHRTLPVTASGGAVCASASAAARSAARDICAAEQCGTTSTAVGSTLSWRAFVRSASNQAWRRPLKAPVRSPGRDGRTAGALAAVARRCHRQAFSA